MAVLDTDFRPLDNDCTEEQAVDVWLEQTVTANRRHLTGGRNPVHCSILQDTAPSISEGIYFPGGRPYSSIDWSSIAYIPVWLLNGLSEVSVWMLFITWAMGPVRALTDDPAPIVDMEIRLYAPDGRILARSRHEVQGGFGGEGSPPSYPTFFDPAENNWTLSLDSPYSGQPGYGRLEIAIRSRLDEEGVDFRIANNPSSYSDETAWQTQGAHRYPISGPRPGDEAPEVQAVVGSESGEAYDVMTVLENSGDEIVYIWPPSNLRNRNLKIYHLSYIVVRDIAIELRYDKSSIAPIQPEGILPWQPTRADVPSASAQAPTSLYQRKRLLAWGPPGYIPAGRDESWPSTYHVRWPTVGGGASGTIIDESIILDAASGTIEIPIFVCVTVWDQTPSNYFNEGYIRDQASTWEFSVKLQKFDTADTTWISPVEVANSLEEAVLPTYTTTRRDAPILLGAYLRKLGEAVEFLATPTLAEWFFQMKEGQIFDEDRTFIVPILLSVDFDSVDVGDLHRLLVLAENTGADVRPSTKTIDQTLTLQCVGYSAWEVAAL